MVAGLREAATLSMLTVKPENERPSLVAAKLLQAALSPDPPPNSSSRSPIPLLLLITMVMIVNTHTAFTVGRVVFILDILTH